MMTLWLWAIAAAVVEEEKWTDIHNVAATQNEVDHHRRWKLKVDKRLVVLLYGGSKATRNHHEVDVVAVVFVMVVVAAA